MSARLARPQVSEDQMRQPEFAQARREHIADLHYSGVHVECRPARRKVLSGRGEPGNCRYAGAVERFHTHDFAGPLSAACGCPELAT